MLEHIKEWSCTSLLSWTHSNSTVQYCVRQHGSAVYVGMGTYILNYVGLYAQNTTYEQILIYVIWHEVWVNVKCRPDWFGQISKPIVSPCALAMSLP